MKDIPLRKYLESNTQKATAERLGVTQGAVHQMVKDERNVFVRVSSTGSVVAAYEVKGIGSIRSVSRPKNPSLEVA